MCEMLQGWNWKDSQSVSKGSGSGLLCHTEQFSQRGPRDEGSQGS